MDAEAREARLRDIDRQLGELRPRHAQVIADITRFEQERQNLIKQQQGAERWDVC